MDRWMDGWFEGKECGWQVKRCIDGWMDEWISGEIDQWEN